MGGTLVDSIWAAFEQLLSLGVHLLQLAAALVIAAIFSSVLRRPVRRWLRSALLPENAETLIKNAITFGIFLGAATFVLTRWGASWSPLFAAIGVSTLIVALGLQSALQSVAARVLVLFERPYNIGDQIRFTGHDVEGAVEEIGFRTTIIRVRQR